MSLQILEQPNRFINYCNNEFAFLFACSIPMGAVNYRVQATMQVNDKTGKNVATLTETLFPDNTSPLGQVNFRFEEALADLMDTYDLPDAGTYLAGICSLNQLFVQVNFTEQWTGSNNRPLRSNPYQVIKGGIPFENFSSQAETFSYLQGNQQFLTWRPDGKSFPSNADHFLYKLLFDDVKEGLIQVVSSQGTIQPLSFTGSAGDIVFIPCMALLFFTGTIPASYSIQLFDGDEAISEIRNFVVDDTFHEGSKIFAYGNSLGGVDFEYFTGLSSLNEDYSNTEANIYVPLQYNQKQGKRKTFNHIQQVNPHCSTGFKLKAELDNIISELCLADQKWELTGWVRGLQELTAGQQYLPIEVTTKTIKKFTERQRLFATEFDYGYLFTNSVSGKLFTKALPIPYDEQTPIGGRLGEFSIADFSNEFNL